MTTETRVGLRPADSGTSWSQDAPPARRSAPPQKSKRVRRPAARLLVPVAWAAAGLLLASSASTAQGTDLRADRRLQLTELIAREQRAVAELEASAGVLRQDVVRRTAAAAAQSDVVGAAAASEQIEVAAGMRAMTGPGVRVVLDDAPRAVRLSTTLGGQPNDYVVHEQDLQAVVNALRAAGAEAVTLMGKRLVSTSAVRCVGNSVILEGRVYGPPFVVTAIGDPEQMIDVLDRDPGVRFYRTFVDRFGVRYDADVQSSLTVPAYEGSLAMTNVLPVAHS